nr:M56 family metallopeptidase [Bacteroidales bacterium]
MTDFLTYDAKVAAALLAFYLCYRFLLKKETFHRFNRAVLLGTAVLSFLLPLCVITVRRTVELPPVAAQTVAAETAEAPLQALAPLAEPSAPWAPALLAALFWAGVAFVLLRVALSVLSLSRIIRDGELVREEDGCRIIVTERDIDPFSWMKHIVLSRQDWEGDRSPILAHEKAHIARGHSVDVLLVDLLSALQWFNPAVWMLRADLKELHEYEADDAVLRTGADLREYQYLLIRKAVSKSGYSVANSLNHSILKNRITMMSKSRSPLARGLRALYLLPLVCLGLALQAQTVYVPKDKDSEKIVSEKPAVPDGQDVIEMQVREDGSILCNGTVAPDAIVRISAEAGAKMGVVNDLRDWLRELGVRKIYYADPSETTSAMQPIKPTVTDKKLQVATYDEALAGIDRDDICVVRINSLDRVFFGNGAFDDADDILRLGKDFLRKHGARTRFSLGLDRGTSYAAFRRIQSLLTRIYDEVRDEKARELYGKPLSELPEEAQDAVRQ